VKRIAIVMLVACGPKPSTPVTTTPAPAPVVEPPATPEPTPPPAAPITFAIEDSFDISGRGPVAMGRLQGHVEVGDELVVEGSEPPIVVEVLAVELMSDRSGTPTPDTPAGLLLRLPAGSDRETVLVRGATLVRAQ
jgi:translation elongation factor EF-Tu-like GTPase